MPDDYKQRTFLPDEDVDYDSLWPSPKPPYKAPPYKAPMHEWMPGCIVLVVLTGVFVFGIVEYLIEKW